MYSESLQRRNVRAKSTTSDRTATRKNAPLVTIGVPKFGHLARAVRCFVAHGEGTMTKKNVQAVEVIEDVKAVMTAKRLLAQQIEQRMESLGMNITNLAVHMGTSRNQVLRVLDPKDTGITMKTLFRVARVLDLTLQVEFVDDKKRKAKPGLAAVRAQ
jgi:hypothetical protein